MPPCLAALFEAVRRQSVHSAQSSCPGPLLHGEGCCLLRALLGRTGKFLLTGLPCLVGHRLTGWVLGKYLQVLETRTGKEFTSPHGAGPSAVVQWEPPVSESS